MDNNFYAKDCPGHNILLSDECITCSPDYDLSHYPNNYDCSICKSYFIIRKRIEERLKEKDRYLKEEILERITINLFLRQLINPVDEKKSLKYIDESIENNFWNNKKMGLHLKNSKKININQKRTYVGIV